MRRLPPFLRVSIAIFALATIPGRAADGAAESRWVDPAPSPPDASASLPQRQTPFRSEADSPAPRSENKSRLVPAQSFARPLPHRSARVPRSTSITRLPPTPSSLTAPDSSPLEVQASEFINSYWENTSGDKSHVVPYLLQSYAPTVLYYGRPTSRERILKEKDQFIARWPLRRTWPMEGAGPQVSCNHATAECEITGFRVFDAVSDERGVRSAGIVRYNYTVRFGSGSSQVVAEDSRVVSRE
jgi:hypothetical protein